MLLRQHVKTVGAPTDQTVIVPDSATSLVAFVVAGEYQDSITGEFKPTRALISADLSDTYSSIVAGNSTGLLASSEQNFPEFPVSAGERLLVAFQGQSSAVIYYRDAS